MQKNSKNRLIMNIAFLVVIFVLIIIVGENSFKDIFQQLASTSLLTLFIVVLLGFLYQLLEGKVVQLIADPFCEEFSQKDGFFLSGSVAFYRVITLGAGTLVSEVQYYREKGMKMSQGIGVTVLHMMMYKLAVLTYAVFGLVLQFSRLWHERPQYIALVLFGIVVTAIIVIALALLASSINLQVGVMLFCNKVFKSRKIRDWIDNLNLQIFSLRETFQTIVQDRTKILRIYYWSLFKLFFWYLIPYAILFQLHPNLNFLTSLSFISMVVVTAGVIPTPAGVGSFEFIYLLLFRPLVGEVDTLSSLLLYRFSTYVLPFLIGLVYVLLKKRRQISSELREVRKEKNNS
ncbi:lysylphosphatidylglycerol synthase transmembrane domain-containing protein [Enterococcus sp. LJL120]